MMKIILYIAVLFILILSTGCQKENKVRIPTDKYKKSIFYGQVIQMPKKEEDFADEFSFANYVLWIRDDKVSNETLIKKIYHQNTELFSHLKIHKNDYCLPKNSIIFPPSNLSKKELQSAKPDQHKTVDLYNQTLIEYKSKMFVKASGKKTKVRVHPKGNLVLQSVNKKKIHYNITFNHPTKIERFYYKQPNIRVNGIPSAVEVWTYKICINGSCKNSFYQYDDNLNWQDNSYFDKSDYEKKIFFQLNKKVRKIYCSIDNYRDDTAATPGYVELESDYSFSFKGLSEEAIVVGNLQKRQDKTLNENLIRQIAIDNPQLFRYVQKFHKTFHVSRTSLAHLPKDVSISYALKHSADIYKTGRYKDRNNRHKKWNNSKRRLGTSNTKYHSKHKVKVTGKSTVKIKKSHKKKTSKYIDFSQGI